MPSIFQHGLAEKHRKHRDLQLRLDINIIFYPGFAQMNGKRNAGMHNERNVNAT